MSAPVRIAGIAAALSMTVLVAAHVGSPDAYFSGMAGPYAVDIAVRPPQVVPGIAEIFVKVADPRVTDVVVRPVFWLAGSKGAPTGDAARPIKGTPGAYAGQLWLMRSGSYSVHVTLAGPSGTGTAVIPVGAVATGQLRLEGGMRWLLAVLGLLLAAGLVTTVRAAAGESQVPPGEEITPSLSRRAHVATFLAVPVVALLALGGARWWNAEAESYRRTLYKPLATHSSVSDSAGVPTLTLSVLDSFWLRGDISPVFPDHGKPAHLFLARADSLDVFAHLHPSMPDGSQFVVALPPLPAGKYRVFNDVVHESGLQRTLVDSFTLVAPLRGANEQSFTGDDAWFNGVAGRADARVPDASFGDGFVARWLGAAHPTAGLSGVLRVALRDARGKPIDAEPYLGMHGHAVVMRRDGGVFVHLHPSGTSAMASQLAFALRDRGDTTSRGRLLADIGPMTMVAPAQLEEISFPYAFPSAGEYRVWIQIRTGGQVRTAAFDVTVGAAAN